MEQELFQSSLVPDQESQSVPQSQLLDPGLFTDKTIPEFDEQDYTSHRNVYVAVHVPKRSSKHRHKSRRRHSRANGHGYHSNHGLNDSIDYDNNIQAHVQDQYGNIQDHHDNQQSYHGDTQVDVEGEQADNKGNSCNHQVLSTQSSIGFNVHKTLQATQSDVTQELSKQSGQNGRPRYHKSLSVPHKADDLVVPERVREPGTPCNPCDRVKFILGTDDTDITGCHDPTVHTVFTELEELKYDENDQSKMEWKETARWVKFEEHVEEEGNKWSKPHVATLSLHSLFELRSCLLKGNVLLDMKADNLAQISDYVLDNLVCSGQLEEENRDKVRSALLQKHKHLNSRKESENKILESIRSLGDIGRINSLRGGDMLDQIPSHHRFGSFTKSASNIAGMNGSRMNSRRGSAQVPAASFTEGTAGSGGGSLNRLEEEGQGDSEQDLAHLPKSTASFMKKIPPGSEASNVLVGEVDFLNHSIIAFVRLSEGHILGDLTEVPIPTRFLFILLGPTGNQERYHEIGRSIATLMSDDVFHEVAYRARNRGDLLAGIDEFLDKVTVLPPGEWDPQIRLEPPSRIPSQYERKQSVDPRKKSTISLKAEVESKPPVKWNKRPFQGLVSELLRCYSVYRSDLSNALSLQFISSLLLIYFANIAIAFLFGTYYSKVTQGAMGVKEMILAVSISNFFYSIFSGQPLVILAATGPTVIFEQLLFMFCSSINIPFLEFRFWVGLWTFLIILVMVGLNSSAIVRLATRFTYEMFSVLISFVFIWDSLAALWDIHLRYPYNQWILQPSSRRQCDCYQYPDRKSMMRSNRSNATRVGSFWDVQERDCSSENLRGFAGKDCPGNLFETHDVFLMSVILFFGTFLLCLYLKKFRTSIYFRTIIRRVVSDFGVFIAVCVWVCVDLLAAVNTPKVAIPNVFAEGTQFFTSPNRTDLYIYPLDNGLPHWAIGAALVPALLASILLFVNQHITQLIVNKKDNKLKKGPGYHVDLFLVGIMVFFNSVMGLPWVVGATILSVAHVQSLHLYDTSGSPGEPPAILGVREQRVTLFMMSVLVGFSILFYSVAQFIPLPVLYGLLFYLGVTSLCGVQFVQRFKLLFIPNKYKPDYEYLRRVSNVKIHLYTLIQAVLLVLLIALQAYQFLRVSFPVIVVGLMIMRWLLGFIFPCKTLEVLDDPLPSLLYCKRFEIKKCSEVQLEECSKWDEMDEVDGVVTNEPSTSSQNSPVNQRKERRSASAFNITHEVNKCDIWRTMVKDLDVPYSSPRRTPASDTSRPSITVTNVEKMASMNKTFIEYSPPPPELGEFPDEVGDSPHELGGNFPLREEAMSEASETSEQNQQTRSKACRQLFTSTAV